ncbi:MAG: hypothetical protein WCG55_04615 [bacterium]
MEKILRQNWFKICIFGLGILIIVILYLVLNPSRQNTVSETTSTSSVDLEAKCSSQAEKVFANDWSNPSGGISNYTYKNHYDNKTGKCYIVVSGVGAGGENYRLSDAYEHGTYIALCSSYTVDSKMDSCDYPNSRSEKFDVNKFNNFIKPYMEN